MPTREASNEPNSQRFFVNKHGPYDPDAWYYRAREGTFGPFQTREDAERDLESLKERHPTRRRELFKRIAISIRNLKD